MFTRHKIIFAVIVLVLITSCGKATPPVTTAATTVAILGAAHSAGEFTWWRNNGKGFFEKITLIDGIPGAIYIDAGDLDSDGDPDLIGASEISWLVLWLENDGAFAYTRHNITTAFSGSGYVMAADLDADGDLDIAGAGVGGNGSVVWWENLLTP